jgi:hypothetical protein
MQYKAGNGKSWYGLKSTNQNDAIKEVMHGQWPKAKKCKIIVQSFTRVRLECRGDAILIEQDNT